jgi:anti-sigma B factor antagonist
MDPFDVEVTQEGPAALIAVSGEVDLSTSPKLRTACMDAAQAGATTVRIDLGNVTFLDSSGISVLVQAQKRLESEGSALVLHRVSGQTRRVLDIAGLNDFFAFSDEPAR